MRDRDLEKFRDFALPRFPLTPHFHIFLCS
jgi:hypothetical protein